MATSKNYLHCFREEIFTWQAYPASQTGFPIKLDAMESPYPLGPDIQAAWREKIAEYEINRYPESNPIALHQQLMEYAEVPDFCRLLFGNGSDELIQLIMLALAKPDNSVLSPQPGFAVYKLAADIVGLRYIPVPLNSDDFSINETAFLEEIRTHSPALICLAQPNNPTGNLWPADTVETIIQHAPGYVLIDEAYVPFSSRHFMQLLNQYENVLVLRTFSKIGFAGLRFGFLAGHPQVIAQLDKLRLPYNTGSLVHRGIEFALEHQAYFQRKIDETLNLRETLLKELQQISSVQAFPSETNFILFRVPEGAADTVFTELKKMGILIKLLSSSPGLQDCLRVTVGSAAENREFIQALKTILNGLNCG